MQGRRLVVVLAALAAVVVSAPATAQAADADVLAAWSSQDRALKSGGTSLTAALRKAQKARFRRVAPVVAAIKRLEQITAAVRSDVARQTSSTANGASARQAVLRSLSGFTASLRSLRRAMQAAARGRLASAHALLRRSQRESTSASDDASDARVYFDAARREPPPPPPPPPPDQQQPPPPQNPPPSGGGGGGGGGGGEQPPPEEPPPPPPPPPSCTEAPLDPNCTVPYSPFDP